MLPHDEKSTIPRKKTLLAMLLGTRVLCGEVPVIWCWYFAKYLSANILLAIDLLSSCSRDCVGTPRPKLHRQKKVTNRKQDLFRINKQEGDQVERIMTESATSMQSDKISSLAMRSLLFQGLDCLQCCRVLVR